MKRIVALLVALWLTLVASPGFAAPAPGLCSLRQVPDAKATAADDGQSQLVVYYREAGADQVAGLGLNRAQVKSGNSLSESVDVIEFASRDEAEKALESLRQSPDVLAADYNDRASLAALPNDPFVQTSKEWYFEQIGADSTWDAPASAKAIVIAVLDTGADTSHPDLQGRLTRGYDYIRDTAGVIDLHGHGTGVTGCAVAATNNALGVAGVCGKANVRVAPYRVGGATASDNNVYIAYAVAAIDDIVTNRPEVRIINMSFTIDTQNAALKAAVARARAAGKIMVAAAGNDGRTAYRYPASFDGVISVGATDARDDIATFSQHNDKVDLTAPGVNVATTLRGGVYGYGSGTSFSAPIVSGCCAVLLNKNAGLSAQAVESVLCQTALELGADGRDPYYGEGRVRLDLAWQAVSVPPKSGDDETVGLWLGLMAASAVIACAILICRKSKKRK